MADVKPYKYSGTPLCLTRFASGDTIGLLHGGTGADLSATGGSGQYVKQSSAGAALSVGTIAASDLPTGIDATKIAGGGVTSTEFNYLANVTSDIQTQIDGKAASSHTHAASDITSGTLDVARIPTAIPATSIGGGAVSNTEFGYLDGVTGAIQTQIDGKVSGILTSPSTGQFLRYNGSAMVNASIAAGDLPTGIDALKIGGGGVSNTEFSYLDGVSSAIQPQLDGKAASSHSHSASDITSGTLSTARLPTGIDAANIGGGGVSNTEFGYLDGVTSAIQTQINGKVTGTVSSPTTGQVLRYNGSTMVNAAIAASDLPTAIDAAKIGGGTVSNTEFSYLDGVTSAIQTQLDKLRGAQSSPYLCRIPLYQQRAAILPSSDLFSLWSGTARTIAGGNQVAVPGGYSWSFSGTGATPAAYVIKECYIPVDTARAYTMRIWAANTVNTTQRIYVGVKCYDESGTFLTSTPRYFLCSNALPAAGPTGSWYEAVIQGEGAASNNFATGTRWVEITIQMGYGSPSGAWTTEFSIPEFFEHVPAARISTGTVSDTEFGYLDGVTGAIQTQLDGKAASSHSHSATDITSGTLNVARLPTGIDAAKIGAGGVSNTEFGYLDGVTSAIQTQINGKVTGTVSSPSSGQVLRYNGTNFANAALAAGDIDSALALLAARHSAGPAGGTVDALTVTVSSLAGTTVPLGTILVVFTSGANTSTTPTLAVNGGTPETIKDAYGGALAVGAIPASAFVLLYKSALSWNLLTANFLPLGKAIPNTANPGASVRACHTNGANGYLVWNVASGQTHRWCVADIEQLRIGTAGIELNNTQTLGSSQCGFARQNSAGSMQIGVPSGENIYMAFAAGNHFRFSAVGGLIFVNTQGNINLSQLLCNARGVAMSAMTATTNSAQANATSVPSGTGSWTNICSVSGVVTGKIEVNAGPYVGTLKWDGTTLSVITGCSDAEIIVGGTPSGNQVAWRVSGTSLQAQQASGSAVNCSAPFMPVRI